MTNRHTDKILYKPLILLDLDGVLNIYRGKYNPKKIAPAKIGTRKFLEKLAKNYRIFIFTSQEYNTVYKWLEENNLSNFIEDITNKKLHNASIFLDDRAINFDGDFNKAYAKIKNFKPHWKK